MTAALSEDERASLLAAARAVREHAHAPYSGFAVGAALLAEDGSVTTGVNVENAAYGSGICAERSAVVGAVSQGRRAFRAIAVVGPGRDPVPPCGACRQVLREFPAGRDLQLLAAGADGDEVLAATLDELLPHSFGPEQLDVAPGAPSEPAGAHGARPAASSGRVEW